jgi:hypothetical protein
MYRARVAPWNSDSWKPSGRLDVHRDRDEKAAPQAEVEDKGGDSIKE